VRILAVALLSLCSCSSSCSCSKPSTPVSDAASPSTVVVFNDAPDDTIVSIAFGSNSVVTASGWTFCNDGSAPSCVFPLKSRAMQDLPLGGKYFNATIAFGAPTVGCGSTKAEININNSKWYDITDVSLVDGYSNGVVIEVTDANGLTKLGPPVGRTGNEKIFGLYPLGCDICVARDQPSCGMSKGKDGCKGGTQYNPDVPCQYQGPTMSGGSSIVVKHVGTPM
jgi:hypothetical protein